MTFESFNKLSLEAQEAYINLGGKVDLPVDQSGSSSFPADAGQRSQEGISSGNMTVLGSSPNVAVSETKEAPSASPPDSSVFDGLDIQSPLELLFLLDDDLASGRESLHDWQIQHLTDFASQDFTAENPFQSVVRACNSSGKDKYIIAPEVVWLCMKYKDALGVVTSSSGVQLDKQTCRYITKLCEAANRKWGKQAGNNEDFWKCNYRYYECLLTGSSISCFATDEPGKAEGWHPTRPRAKMGIFVSEDKSVPDEINTALNRCLGYTHRVHVSTPGLPMGHFYDMCSTAVSRREIKDLKEVKPEDYVEYHITWKQCPHIRQSEYNRTVRDTPGGENSPVIKSQFMAEFGTTDEMVVVPYTYIWKCKSRKPDSAWIKEERNKAGLDLSDGGDETCLVVRNGNRVLAVIPFRFDNTEDTIAFLEQKFKEWELTFSDAYIFADCGGIGKPILDRLKRLGWKNIRYCDNRNKSNRPKTYKNWGAQSWFDFGECVKRGELILLDDAKLIRQLSTRYYKITEGNVHQLLSKLEMRSRGYPSPDRADACVLAFIDYKTPFKVEPPADDERPLEDKDEESLKPSSHLTLQGLAEGYNKSFKERTRWKPERRPDDLSDIADELAAYNQRVLRNNKVKQN